MKRKMILMAGGLCLAAAPATAQSVRFSIDLGSGSIGSAGHDGSTLNAGSVLTPEYDPPALGPLNAPGTLYSPAAIGLSAAPREIDALSHGRDARPNAGLVPGQLWFSVDRGSFGIGPSAFPSVRSERPEAASDLFVNVLGVPALPADGSVSGPNVAALDGNGLAHPVTGAARGGLGVVEIDDAVDGFDQVLGAGGSLAQMYLSLSPASSAAHGFQPGDVLHSDLAGTISMYLSAPALGLDLVGGSGSDDLDALAVWDDGDGLYEPPATVNNPEEPYAWGPGAGDLVLFSVSRNSAVVGQLDSHFGIPIQPGDVLTIPEPLSTISGNPAIVLASERIFLRADRSGTNLMMDDLNALDLVFGPLGDCDGNGYEDAVDIAAGAADADLNGYLDSCESSVNYCTAGLSSEGCQATLSSTGYASATASSGFVVTASNANGAKSSLFFFGANGRMATPWGCTSSYRCVVSPVFRTPAKTTSGVAGGCGDVSRDLNLHWCASCTGASKNPGAGATAQVQLWYRDPKLTGCVNKTAFSDALEFQVLP
jgi:hypothetical protein